MDSRNSNLTAQEVSALIGSIMDHLSRLVKGARQKGIGILPIDEDPTCEGDTPLCGTPTSEMEPTLPFDLDKSKSFNGTSSHFGTHMADIAGLDRHLQYVQAETNYRIEWMTWAYEQQVVKLGRRHISTLHPNFDWSVTSLAAAAASLSIPFFAKVLGLDPVQSEVALQCSRIALYSKGVCDPSLEIDEDEDENEGGIPRNSVVALCMLFTLPGLEKHRGKWEVLIGLKEGRDIQEIIETESERLQVEKLEQDAVDVLLSLK